MDRIDLSSRISQSDYPDFSQIVNKVGAEVLKIDKELDLEKAEQPVVQLKAGRQGKQAGGNAVEQADALQAGGKDNAEEKPSWLTPGARFRQRVYTKHVKPFVVRGGSTT